MRHIVALSGGKDSTALAIYMKDRVDADYVFADTGREIPEIYEFINQLSLYLGKKVSRVYDGWYCEKCDVYGTEPEMKDCPQCQAKVRPRDFDYYMERWSNEEDGPMIPGQHSRWCTKHLKLRPFDRFVGKEPVTIYIGLRADEDRDGNYGTKENIIYKYPFQDDGIDLDGVYKILEESKVQLPNFYKWRSTGGCWCCPFQRISDWQGLRENYPDLFKIAMDEENRSNFRWNSRINLNVIWDRGPMPKQLTLFEDYDDDDMPCLICAK